jgi:hypothetical protein
MSEQLKKITRKSYTPKKFITVINTNEKKYIIHSVWYSIKTHTQNIKTPNTRATFAALSIRLSP